jgi:shikimate kinase
MNHIFLTGYRCTGKTSVGKLLSQKLGWNFVDADELLVTEAQMTVAQIVAQFGWDDFRNRESRTLLKICDIEKTVVATGGGVILRKENVNAMKDSGTVIWLKASAETIAERMTGDGKTGEQRPGLTDKGALKEIEETLNQRLPLYENAMDFSVDTDGFMVEDICECILGELGFGNLLSK